MALWSRRAVERIPSVGLWSRRAIKRIPSVALWSRRAVKRIPSVALRSRRAVKRIPSVPVGHRPGLTYPFATARFSLAFRSCIYNQHLHAQNVASKATKLVPLS